ncbi:DUF6282 family protein [Hominifimenecus sp. rT4P-3]|uniref:DUF6282 family protein n=1 Tax=Hominifimenecus sp. rT4P-3 TaxID=3242979 RepID=UPI003DA2BC8A
MEQETRKAAARELLRGAYDIHIHSNPSLGPDGEGFGISDEEVAEEAFQAGLSGICLKNTESATIFRGWTLNRQERFSSAGFHCYSSLTLNLPVGGINPYAVDYAICQGAACIWFPTYSAENMRSALEAAEKGGVEISPWNPARRLLPPPGGKGICVLDERGQVLPEVRDVIAMTKEAGVCLATGHLSPKESYAVCREGVRMGHRKMIFTHPDNRYTRAPYDMLEDLAGRGVYLEKTYFSHVRDYQEERAYDYVRRIGAEHFFLTSDTGQREMLRPAKAMEAYVEAYLEHGFSVEEIGRMVRENPGFLIKG